MGFLKCVGCHYNNIKIISILSNGFVKSKCMKCGLASFQEKEIKKPEVFYRK